MATKNGHQANVSNKNKCSPAGQNETIGVGASTFSPSRGQDLTDQIEASSIGGLQLPPTLGLAIDNLEDKIWVLPRTTAKARLLKNLISNISRLKLVSFLANVQRRLNP